MSRPLRKREEQALTTSRAQRQTAWHRLRAPGRAWQHLPPRFSSEVPFQPLSEFGGFIVRNSVLTAGGPASDSDRGHNSHTHCPGPLKQTPPALRRTPHGPCCWALLPTQPSLGTYCCACGWASLTLLSVSAPTPGPVLLNHGLLPVAMTSPSLHSPPQACPCR